MFDYSGYRNNQKSDTHKRHADNKSCHERAYGENRKSNYTARAMFGFKQPRYYNISYGENNAYPGNEKRCQNHAERSRYTLAAVKIVENTTACPSTGANITSEKNALFTGKNAIAKNAGAKPFKISSARHTEPINIPQNLNALAAPGFPSSESAHTSTFLIACGIMRQNCTEPSKKPPITQIT